MRTYQISPNSTRIALEAATAARQAHLATAVYKHTTRTHATHASPSVECCVQPSSCRCSWLPSSWLPRCLRWKKPLGGSSDRSIFSESLVIIQDEARRGTSAGGEQKKQLSEVCSKYYNAFSWQCKLNMHISALVLSVGDAFSRLVVLDSLG